MTYHQPTKQAAKGQWRGILQALGVAPSFLSGRNGPCPVCGGNDRWQWVNDGGEGGGVCRKCGGKADGIHLVAAIRDCEWKEAARLVDEVLGNSKFEPEKPADNADRHREMLREVWQASAPAVEGDATHRYLTARGVGQRVYAGLRTAESLYHGRDGAGQVITHPAMIGVVSDVMGKPATLHRTFLDGDQRLDRKIMPGSVPDGAAIRLVDITPADDVLGIAEGIETALAASALFTVPVWSVISTSMMRNWLPPKGIREVVIFADNDKAFGGQAAAYDLAHRLSTQTHKFPEIEAVSVQVPKASGTDWLDEWSRR